MLQTLSNALTGHESVPLNKGVEEREESLDMRFIEK